MLKRSWSLKNLKKWFLSKLSCFRSKLYSPMRIWKNDFSRHLLGKNYSLEILRKCYFSKLVGKLFPRKYWFISKLGGKVLVYLWRRDSSRNLLKRNCSLKTLSKLWGLFQNSEGSCDISWNHVRKLYPLKTFRLVGKNLFSQKD